MVLSSQSPHTFVWHDNAGQNIPSNTKQITSSVSTTGITINIAANARIAEPIILINSAAKTNNSQNIINVGNSAEVMIIEYNMSDDREAVNQVNTAINCADGSIVKHCILHQASKDDTISQQTTTTITQAQNTDVASNVFTFGGGKSKVVLNIALNGKNASCQTACLAYTNGKEKQDVFFNIEHLQPQCTSNSLARGVLKDQSTTDFIGKITVHPGASKTSADLQIKNLLCSDKAQTSNKPELEIYNDDVKCSHGSSTGQLDEDALFYMRSRGIDLIEATSMLIASFIKPVIDNCQIPLIAEYVQNMVAERT